MVGWLSNRRRWSAVFALAALAGCGCSGESGSSEITDVRVVQRAGAPSATSAQRFGFSSGGAAPHEPSDPGLRWELPSGWQELPATQMRRLNLAVAGARDADSMSRQRQRRPS